MRTNNATRADPPSPAARPRGSVGPRLWYTPAWRRFAGVRALLLLALAATALPTASRAAPLLQLSEDVMVVVEEPSDGQTVAGDVVVRGWAIDRRAVAGSGVRTTPGGVQVWLDRSAGSATGQLLGDAVYGGDRPAVAQQRGDAFRRSGFALSWNACLVPAGPPPPPGVPGGGPSGPPI